MKKLLAVIVLGALSYSVQAQCGKCPHHSNSQSNCSKAQTEATTEKQKSTPCAADTKTTSDTKVSDTKSQKSDKQTTNKTKETPKEEPKSNNSTSSQPATTPTNSNQGGRVLITPKN